MSQPVLVAGAVGSPYSRKMRAVLRYRRIPSRWVHQLSPEQENLPPPPLPLLPVVYMPGPDGGYEATSDSTFQIKRLEAEHLGRSIIPDDPAIAFLDFLIEDYADEWATKMMFHYRWAIQENVDNANNLLPRWNMDVPEEICEGFADTFGKRQVGRLSVVGSNPETGPIIEASYKRLLDILERHLREQRFTLGRRPGSGDFGLFGQLSQLVGVEPTSQALARAAAPRVITWCDNVEDLSGIEVEASDWTARDALPDTLRELLAEIGRTYAPFLLANAKALETGAQAVDGTVDGTRWTQDPFKYQGKCLQWLREDYAALAPSDRAAVDAALKGSGCEILFDG